MGLCRAYLLQGRFRDTIESCEAARAIAPTDINVNLFVNLFLCAAYAELGEADKAAEAKSHVLHLVPDFKIPPATVSTRPAYLERRNQYLLPGLHKAGFVDAAAG